MGKFLFFIFAIWLVVVIIRFFQRRSALERRRAEKVTQTVRCAACGLHLPEGQAVRDGERFYCCEAHRSGRR